MIRQQAYLCHEYRVVQNSEGEQGEFHIVGGGFYVNSKTMVRILRVFCTGAY
jgi:hypothetical protein